MPVEGMRFRAAASLGIPAAVHESNAIPGLTTRLLEKHADLIMVGFEEWSRSMSASFRYSAIWMHPTLPAPWTWWKGMPVPGATPAIP